MLGWQVKNRSHTKVAGIRYMLRPYCFSSNGISMRSHYSVTYLLSLLPLYVYFLTCHFYFILQFYACYCSFFAPFREALSLGHTQ